VSNRWFLSLAALFLFAWGAAAQSPSRGFPKPPPSMDPQSRDPQQTESSATPSRRTDLTQAQREAEDLARMAQTVPADVTKIREGMLPKDAIEKLKQIEKLSKRLRSELNP
jgi:hypothetical protein